MTGEMSRGEVNRKSYPAFFALRDAIKKRYLDIDVSVEPFDQYRGPYVRVDMGIFKIWAGERFTPYGTRNEWVVERKGEMKSVFGGKGVFEELDRVFKKKGKTYSWDKRKPEIGGYDPELDEG